MKKINVAIGFILSLTAIFQSKNYLFDYNILSQYGKGYVIGSVLLMIVGFIFIYRGVRKSNTSL